MLKGGVGGDGGQPIEENYNVKIRERMGKVLDGCHHTTTGNYPKRLNSFLRWISTEDVFKLSA